MAELTVEDAHAAIILWIVSSAISSVSSLSSSPSPTIPFFQFKTVRSLRLIAIFAYIDFMGTSVSHKHVRHTLPISIIVFLTMKSKSYLYGIILSIDRGFLHRRGISNAQMLQNDWLAICLYTFALDIWQTLLNSADSRLYPMQTCERVVQRQLLFGRERERSSWCCITNGNDR